MKNRILALIFIALLTGSPVAVFAVTNDQVFDFTDQVGYPENNTKLFKHAGKVYAIHSTGDTLITEDAEDTTTPIQVSVETNQNLSSWEDASNVAPFSSLTGHVFEIEKFFTFKKYIYAFVLTTENTSEIWRLRKTGSAEVWEQVGQDTFSSQLTGFSSAVVRLTTSDVSGALYVVGQSASGNQLYKTINGTEWQRLDSNSIFTGDGSTSIVRLLKHTVNSIRYVYAFTQDGQVLRAQLEHMNDWESVFTIQALSTDLDTPNPDFTLTSAAQIGGKLYVIGEAENDEPDGQLVVSTDWENASITQYFNSSSGHWVFHKLKVDNTLYVLADLSEGMSWLGQITDADAVETLLSSDVDFGHDESAQFTSLINFKGTDYFSYRTSDGSQIYSLSQ